MGDLKEKFIQTYQSARAIGAGIDEGAIDFLGAIPDGIAHLAGMAAKSVGIKVDQTKGWASGHGIRDYFTQKAHEKKGYDPKKETPAMTDIRETTATVTDLAATGASFFVSGPAAAGSKLIGRAVGTASIADGAVTGFLEGFHNTP